MRLLKICSFFGIFILNGCRDGGWVTNCDWDKCTVHYENTKAEKQTEEDIRAAKEFFPRCPPRKRGICETAHLIVAEADAGYIRGPRYDPDLEEWRAFRRGNRP